MTIYIYISLKIYIYVFPGGVMFPGGVSLPKTSKNPSIPNYRDAILFFFQEKVVKIYDVGQLLG